MYKDSKFLLNLIFFYINLYTKIIILKNNKYNFFLLNYTKIIFYNNIV